MNNDIVKTTLLKILYNRSRFDRPKLNQRVFWCVGTRVLFPSININICSLLFDNTKRDVFKTA